MRVVAEHRRAVGLRLRELRKARDMSQEDAAYAVGVTLKTWGDWERGKRDPYDQNWRKIGKAFAVDPAEVRGTPPAAFGLGGRDDQAEGGVDGLRAQVGRLEDHLNRIEAALAARVSHDELVAGRLEEQNALLERQTRLLEDMRTIVGNEDAFDTLREWAAFAAREAPDPGAFERTTRARSGRRSRAST